ncbi:MAG TPA: MFS transporter [Gemmataceae bacterium]|nr:MFS transporter [Gemmataceae bacterium]
MSATSLDPSVERAVLRAVSRRLLPFLFLLYVFNILDRVNIGFARLQFLEDLDLSKEVYGTAVSVFFLGYFLFEVPSNLMLRHMGARRWIARILMSWGLISATLMFVRGPWSLYLLRFLLGLAEAGFFPGIILYLSYWFPARERARAVSLFMTGSAVTGIVGNPISGTILGQLGGTAGLKGWQWLFLLEGVPTVLLGVVALFYLTDRPEQASWLTPAQRDWLTARMNREEHHREQHHRLTLLQALAQPRVLLLCALYFTVSMGANSFGAYAPQIVKDHFVGVSDEQVGLLMAVPSLGAIVSMTVVGVHSDRTGERRWHVAAPAFVAALGWLMTARLDMPWLVLLGLVLAHSGMLSMLPTFWTLPTSFLSGSAAAGGIAFINSVGNLGGFAGPQIIGRLEARGHFSEGLIVLAAALVIGGMLALRARHDAALENPHTDAK